jgi:lipid II:glycine glycyltransferase (peptidoglycan interpeptide bridge formation enzyme)
VRFPVETILVKPEVGVERETAFLNAAVDVFRGLNADVIVPATFNSLFRTAPDAALSVRYDNIVVDLTQSEEVLWQAVHHKHRNVIRNAMRQGVTIRSGLEHLDTAYELTLASFLRSAHGIAARARVKARLDYREFCRLVQGLGEHVEVLVAEREGIPQCAAVVPFSRYSAYYMHGGSIAKPVLGASNLLQWEAMRRLRGMGVARYNFFGVRAEPERGSKAEGLRKFKERFGGKVLSGLMWKVPLHRGRYLLYELAAWLRNGGDVVDQEQRRQAAGQPRRAVVREHRLR